MLKKNFQGILFFLVLLATDLLTKHFFYTQAIGENLFFLEPVFNTGVSWGISIPLWFVISISIFVLFLFIWLYFKKHISLFVVVFLLAGTLGNLIDRILLGGVRDFILIFDRFPVFNFADIFLNIGIIGYFLKNFLFCKKKIY